MPDYLGVPAERLGEGSGMGLMTVGDANDLARRMAADVFAELERGLQGRPATLIIPVGPVDQFPLLAEMLNARRVSCREAMFINMDEYLADGDEYVNRDHPLSFRGFMDRTFYDRLDPELAPREENRVFPDPGNPDEVERLIAARGGVDACFGGIGINGHVAFNEPPEPGEFLEDLAFARLGSRVVTLARETRTINSVTVGGEISVIPKRAVTVGMREILGARRVRLYCNRPWQAAVVRRVLHGPISATCPASLIRRHSDAVVTVTRTVAAAPRIGLR